MGLTKAGEDDGSIQASHDMWKSVCWTGYIPTFQKFNNWCISTLGFGVQSYYLRPAPVFGVCHAFKFLALFLVVLTVLLTYVVDIWTNSRKTRRNQRERADVR
jgi:hypothetical protein